MHSLFCLLIAVIAMMDCSAAGWHPVALENKDIWQ